MAYEKITGYHLHMPLYFVEGTLTEYTYWHF